MPSDSGWRKPTNANIDPLNAVRQPDGESQLPYRKAYQTDRLQPKGGNTFVKKYCKQTVEISNKCVLLRANSYDFCAVNAHNNLIYIKNNTKNMHL